MAAFIEIRELSKTGELEKNLCNLIKKRQLQADEPILSELKLARQFKVSRVTVRRAIAALVNRNVLYAVHGKGTFVANPEALNYSPRRPPLTKTIGLIVPAINTSFFPDIARGAEDQAWESKYHVIFCNTDNNEEKEQSYLRQLLDKGLAGLIIAPTGASANRATLRQLTVRGMPFVFVNSLYPGLDANVVISDDIDGGFQATRHLLALGHRRIGHIRGPLKVSPSLNRTEGYKQAMREAGLSMDQALIEGGQTFEERDGYRATLKFLEMKAKPTAIFAATDMMAWGAHKALQEAGWRVPEDMALIGYGDVKETAERNIALTSVRQPSYDMGKTACELLLQNISHRGKVQQPRTIILKTKLIIRASCGQYKTANWKGTTKQGVQCAALDGTAKPIEVLIRSAKRTVIIKKQPI